MLPSTAIGATSQDAPCSCDKFHGIPSSFCLAESGQWAKERDEVCALAGIDPDAFRQKVLALHEAGRLSDRKVSA